MTDGPSPRLRQPNPVASLKKDNAEKIAAAILHSRRRGTGPHVPVHVFARLDNVYVLRECYAICAEWERLYPAAYVGVYSGRIDAKRLAEDMQEVLNEYNGKPKGLDPVHKAFQDWLRSQLPSLSRKHRCRHRLAERDGDPVQFRLPFPVAA
jgi:hypothetical protein